MLTNCVLWANDFGQIVDFSSSSTVSYSNVQGGWSGAGSNNIDADPLFVKASTSNCCVFHFDVGCDDPICEFAVCDVEPFCCDVYWDTLCVDLAATLCQACPNDLRLSPGSPCIDAGDNTAVPLGIDTDLDGNPRFLDVPETPDTGNGELPIVDMGAYEALGGGCLAVTTQDVVCHADGSTFTVNIEGLNACTGGTTMVSFTGSGGAAGEEACFTVLVSDGGFCCSTEICVTVPDCSPDCDVNGDGVVGILDYLALLDTWGVCSDCGTPTSCPADFNRDCEVSSTDFLILLANWG